MFLIVLLQTNDEILSLPFQNKRLGSTDFDYFIEGIRLQSDLLSVTRIPVKYRVLPQVTLLYFDSTVYSPTNLLRLSPLLRKPSRSLTFF